MIVILFSIDWEGEDFLYLIPIILIPILILIFLKNFINALFITFLIALFPVFALFIIDRGERNEKKVNEAGLEGQIGKVVETIKGQETGKIKIRGEYWWAKSLQGTSISQGEKVVVKDMERLTVIVEPLLRCPQCGRKYTRSTAPQTCECGGDLKIIKNGRTKE